MLYRLEAWEMVDWRNSDNKPCGRMAEGSRSKRPVES